MRAILLTYPSLDYVLHLVFIHPRRVLTANPITDICLFFPGFWFTFVLSVNNSGGGGGEKQLVKVRSVLPRLRQRNRLWECKPLTSLCAWLVIGLNVGLCVCVWLDNLWECLEGSPATRIAWFLPWNYSSARMSSSQRFGRGNLPPCNTHSLKWVLSEM